MKRRHAIAGMAFSLLVGALIGANDAGLLRWEYTRCSQGFGDQEARDCNDDEVDWRPARKWVKILLALTTKASFTGGTSPAEG